LIESEEKRTHGTKKIKRKGNKNGSGRERKKHRNEEQNRRKQEERNNGCSVE